MFIFVFYLAVFNISVLSTATECTSKTCHVVYINHLALGNIAQYVLCRVFLCMHAAFFFFFGWCCVAKNDVQLSSQSHR